MILQGITLTKIIEQECIRGSVGRNELESGSRGSTVSRTRAEIARRGMEKLGLSAAEIARHLGVSYLKHHSGSRKDAKAGDSAT